MGGHLLEGYAHPTIEIIVTESPGHLRRKIDEETGLPLLDLDDLQAMLVHIGERASELTLEYGNVSKPSVGAIQRSLLQLRAHVGIQRDGDVRTALRLCRKSISLLRRNGRPAQLARGHATLGAIHLWHDDFQKAAAEFSTEE